MLNDFLSQIGTDAKLDFEDSIAVISANYDYSPAAFQNGSVQNAAGQNEGSCKIFAFAKLQQLSEAQTLACFGRFYQDVLNTPEGTDHANIRNFMQTGWQGVVFETMPLTAK
nr:HopJ type III effector protein [Oceanospirillum multiglobuliferum]